MKQSVYLETTVVGYMAMRASRDLRLAANQLATREWWDVDPAGKFFVSFHTFMGAQSEKQRVITVIGWVDPKEITSIPDPKPASNSEPKPVTDQIDKSLTHRYNRPIVVATAPERFAIKSWIPESPPAK